MGGYDLNEWMQWCVVHCSAAAFFVTSKLRTLARDGKTIIASIHQPSSEVFNCFDTLFLLSEGRTIYFGPASKALEVGGHLLPKFGEIDAVVSNQCDRICLMFGPWIRICDELSQLIALSLFSFSSRWAKAM